MPANPSIPTPMALKAIETHYRGHRFRSRLEARWAVFFDTLDLLWEYELEGFELQDGTRYLPDFRVRTPQGSHRWIEVKPPIVSTDSKFESFCKALEPEGETAVLVSGSPLDWLNSGRSFCPRCGAPHKDPLETTIYCWQCDIETPCGGGHPFEANGVMGAIWAPHKGTILIEWDELCHFRGLLMQAAIRAQRARFEHGEEG